MILFVAIILIMFGILFIALSLYDIYCIFGLRKLIKKSNGSSKEDIIQFKSKLNFFVWLIKRSRKVKDASEQDIHNIVKKKARHSILFAIIILFNFIYYSFFCISIGIVFNTMEYQINTVTSAVTTIFSKDDDCQCYAKCTGNEEDDKYSVYNLLFGDTEYERLITAMKVDLTPAEKENFEAINEGEDGRSKSNFIKEHINDSMVTCYQTIVGSNNKFRSGDGLDRSKMSFDELKKDLYDLLCDYKVNGRNPNCECKNCASIQLKYKCLGMEHFKEGWSWDNIWDGLFGDDEEDNSNENVTYSNTPGNATGQYAIKLVDGTYYWYHQSSEGCNYNAKSDTFKIGAGSLHARRSNGNTINDTLAWRGCSAYSTAMAVSNILGEEITAWNIVQDVLKANITKTSSGEVEFTSDKDRDGIGFSLSTVSVDRAKLADRLNKAYGSKGLQAEVIPFTKKSVDKYLDSDKYYAMIINSYYNVYPLYNGGGHYMVIRGKDSSGKYYGMTSAGTPLGKGHDNIIKAMNTSVEWDTLYNGRNTGYSDCIVVYRDKSLYKTSTTTSSFGYNKEVYDILKKSKYKSKALILATVYALLEPKYGKNFAIGAMANVWDEGDVALVEGDWGHSYWDNVSPEVYALRLKRIYDQPDPEKTVDTLLTIDPKTEGIGIGMVQWSGSRRRAILKTYKEMCTTWTRDDMELAEVVFMDKELDKNYKYGGTTGYYYNIAVKPCENKSAGDCAYTICLKYEVPSNKYEKADDRKKYAKDIEKLIKSVTTSGVTAQKTNSSNNSSNNSSSNNSTTESNQTNASTKNSKGQEVADYALQFVGNPYVYGGTSLTSGADCSGFVLSVYKHFGKSLPHHSGSLRSVGKEVKNPSKSNMQPGDIVCYSGHVAIYIGDGKIVHASSPETGIKISDKYNYRTVLAVRRIFN